MAILEMQTCTIRVGKVQDDLKAAVRQTILVSEFAPT